MVIIESFLGSLTISDSLLIVSKIKKDVNRDSHIASSPISQNSFLEEVRYSILTPSQRKLRGYIEFLKFDVTVRKIKKFKFV